MAGRGVGNRGVWQVSKPSLQPSVCFYFHTANQLYVYMDIWPAGLFLEQSGGKTFILEGEWPFRKFARSAKLAGNKMRAENR